MATGSATTRISTMTTTGSQTPTTGLRSTPPEWRDFDGDNNGDANDTDDDNDGVADVEDAFPYDSTESADNDSDGVEDNMDSDDDNDGVDDYDSTGAQLDNCRTTVNQIQANNDGDTSGDLCDDDDDNDGTDDSLDAYPMNDAADTDTDGDGLPDDFLTTSTTSVQTCTVTNTADTATQYCEGTVTATGEALTFELGDRSHMGFRPQHHSDDAQRGHRDPG